MSDLSFNDLPPDPKTALLGLIGSTFAELKRVDEYSVSKNQFTAGIKTDLNKLVAEAQNLEIKPQPQQPQQPQIQSIPVQELQPIPVQNIPTLPIPQEVQSVEDSDQLLLDFYRKITPEDINSRLADIDNKLYQILQILKKVNG